SLFADNDTVEPGVVGQLVVVDAQEQPARRRHRQRLRLRADAEWRAVADPADQRAYRHAGNRVLRTAIRATVGRRRLTWAAPVGDLAPRLEDDLVARLDRDAGVRPRLVGVDADRRSARADSRGGCVVEHRRVDASRAGRIHVDARELIGRDIVTSAFAPIVRERVAVGADLVDLPEDHFPAARHEYVPLVLARVVVDVRNLLEFGC